ncbi:ferrochelatase [Carboxydochorda subterranea]|uniref:Coproporphyrin III ferrochelatase n=1 Tax=Carboxydichorda subterranea TaxID=3109565 RepID=A0ABZ1BVK7_9FIRM|nr:ferrochelatase [Limnochorda sp. L945t]WRP16824.1 ferrochelatase [Limnochorda sp. L945t]
MPLETPAGGTAGRAARRGVLLMAYGSPERLEEIEAYYTHIRGGRPPAPELLEELKARYLAIGGVSPLAAITRRQARALERRLGWPVYVGMRHWHPWIAEAVEAMARDGVREAVGLALAPHASRMSSGAYVQAAREALQAIEPSRRPSFRWIESWATLQPFVLAVARRVREAARRLPGDAVEQTAEGTLALAPDTRVLFTAHSLPERIRTWNDPYPSELERTCQAVAGSLGLAAGRWELAYQSRGRTAEPWLGPDVSEALERLAGEGVGRVVVCPVGFVADHLEVLYDLDVEAAAQARRLGIAMVRTASLNDAEDFIEALARLVIEAGPEDGGWT